MAATFEEVRAALATLNESLTGLTRSYERPPEAIHDFPAALHLPSEGTFEYESFGGACMTKMHRLRLIIVAGARSDLPENDETLVPFIDRVPDLLRTSPTLGLENVTQPAQARDYRLVTFNFANVAHLALEFIVEVGIYDDE